MRSSVLAGKRARALRREMSPPEVMLWSRLRTRSGDGVTFRRQHPIGAYVLDFYCNAARLAVEVDGAHHTEDEQIEHDERRDAWLRSQGLTVMRIPASHIMQSVDEAADGVLLMVQSLLAKRS